MNREPVFATLGPSSIDHYYETNAWPPEGDKALLSAHGLHVGGMIANTASVLGALGARVRHIERIGTEHADIVLGSLEGFGVDTSLVQVSDTARTSTAFVVRTGGERTILIDTDGVECVELVEPIVEALRSASVIVTSLHELRRPTVRAVVFDALDAGVELALDIEPAGLGEITLDQGSIARAGYVFVNRSATLALGLDVRALAADGADVIILDGAQGSTVVADDPATDMHIGAFPVAAIDTTGCSDTYIAAYLFRRLQSADQIVAATFAAAAAGRAATGIGPRHGAVDTDTIERFSQR